MTSSTAWASRPGLRAATPERLAALVESELSRVDGLLFTATAREDLDEIGRWQQLKDQAFAAQLRAVITALGRVPEAEREFVADEIALALGVGVATATNLMVLACRAAELPGLIEAVEHDVLTERHLRLVVEELHQVPLSQEQRQALVLLLLARYAGQTPGELVPLLRQLVLLIDPAAAAARKKAADRGAGVRTYALPDGQAALSAVGPLEQVAAIRAALDAAVEAMPADDRTQGEREFAALTSLVTGGGGGWHAQVLVPFSVLAGGDLEVAEVPGLGPILPSTARELLEQCDTVTQVAVDADGHVIAVSDPVSVSGLFGTGPAAETEDTAEASVTEGPADSATECPAESVTDDLAESATDDLAERVSVDEGPAPATAAGPCPTRLLDDLVPTREPAAWSLPAAVEAALRARPVVRDLTTDAYRPGTRLRRFVQARDTRCVFPGCTRPAGTTDLDHRVPWPLGPTSADNLQCLCRRHHRAKQAAFTVTKDDLGITWWTTRGGWAFPRRPQGC